MKKTKDFWLQLSIKVKLLVYFFIIISIISLFNLYLNNNNYSIVDQFNATMTNYYRINRMLVYTKDNKELVTRYLRELRSEDLEKYEMQKSAMEGILDDLDNQYDSIDAYFDLRAIRNSSNVLYGQWDQAILEKEQNVESYFNIYYEGIRTSEYTESYIENLLYVSLGEGNELYNKLEKEATLMRRISFILIFLSGGLAMFIGLLFTNSFINPIKKLAAFSMKIASGDLDVAAIPIVSKDEVGILAESFNTMSFSIKEYVNDLKEKVVIEKRLHEEELEVIHMEQLLKESQFKALQSQINPHFLFNTLNTISRTAMFEGAKDTVKLTQALSNLFRYKLRNQGSVITLKEELWIAKEFIYLQKFRFKDRLDYKIVADELSLTAIVPIFMLQPIIENAIIHGIEKKVEGGIVRIKIMRRFVDQKELIIVRVTDTGLGMTKERLDKVRGYTELRHHSIGISNVYQRFMLLYPNNASFKMMSKLGYGTCVEFKFERSKPDGNL